MADNTIVGIFAWVVGVIVALAVGSGMINKVLTIPGISDIASGIIVQIAGWVVVVGAIISVILAVFKK
ncbi:MAG: hypothetical protein KKF50_04365 [Nanoarchaeota archaeon]|nr:hypothetical protein [Nanoarchaeota archaeon]